MLPWDVAWLLCLLKLFFRCSMIKVSVPRKRPLFLFILHIDNFFIIPYAESSGVPNETEERKMKRKIWFCRLMGRSCL